MAKVALRESISKACTLIRTLITQRQADYVVANAGIIGFNWKCGGE